MKTLKNLQIKKIILVIMSLLVINFNALDTTYAMEKQGFGDPRRSSINVCLCYRLLEVLPQVYAAVRMRISNWYYGAPSARINSNPELLAENLNYNLNPNSVHLPLQVIPPSITVQVGQPSSNTIGISTTTTPQAPQTNSNTIGISTTTAAQASQTNSNTISISTTQNLQHNSGTNSVTAAQPSRNRNIVLANQDQQQSWNQVFNSYRNQFNPNTHPQGPVRLNDENIRSLLFLVSPATSTIHVRQYNIDRHLTIPMGGQPNFNYLQIMHFLVMQRSITTDENLRNMYQHQLGILLEVLESIAKEKNNSALFVEALTNIFAVAIYWHDAEVISGINNPRFISLMLPQDPNSTYRQNIGLLTDLLDQLSANNFAFVDNVLPRTNGRLLLHVAVIEQANYVVRILSRAGINLNVRDGGGLAALHYATDFAIRSGDPRSLRILLGAGADVNIVDSVGHSPILMIARHHKNSPHFVPVMEMLIESGADTQDIDLSPLFAQTITTLGLKKKGIQKVAKHGTRRALKNIFEINKKGTRFNNYLTSSPTLILPDDLQGIIFHDYLAGYIPLPDRTSMPNAVSRYHYLLASAITNGNYDVVIPMLDQINEIYKNQLRDRQANKPLIRQILLNTIYMAYQTYRANSVPQLRMLINDLITRYNQVYLDAGGADFNKISEGLQRALDGLERYQNVAVQIDYDKELLDLLEYTLKNGLNYYAELLLNLGGFDILKNENNIRRIFGLIIRGTLRGENENYILELLLNVVCQYYDNRSLLRPTGLFSSLLYDCISSGKGRANSSDYYLNNNNDNIVKLIAILIHYGVQVPQDLLVYLIKNDWCYPCDGTKFYYDSNNPKMIRLLATNILNSIFEMEYDPYALPGLVSLLTLGAEVARDSISKIQNNNWFTPGRSIEISRSGLPTLLLERIVNIDHQNILAYLLLDSKRQFNSLAAIAETAAEMVRYLINNGAVVSPKIRELAAKNHWPLEYFQ